MKQHTADALRKIREMKDKLGTIAITRDTGDVSMGKDTSKAALQKIKNIQRDLIRMNKSLRQSIVSGNLIISTGDISDVDGFFALAKYAQSGANVLFIMNYPAYLNPKIPFTPEDTKPDDGCGYKFSIDQFLTAADAQVKKESLETYNALRRTYEEITEDGKDPHGLKRMFTDLGFILASNVWSQTQQLLPAGSPRGKLFFCIGGINTISPFSAKSVKNEMAVYVEYLKDADINFGSYLETKTYDVDKKEIDLAYLLGQSKEIYIDFNGSMAFYHDTTMDKILYHAGPKIKGVFVMGGVYSFKPPQTMPKIDGVLNRFSCATMNQLYSPGNSAKFFSDMSRFSIPIFMVANNEIHDNLTKADDGVSSTDVGWKSFLSSNGIQSDYIENLSNTYYNNSMYSPPRKAFDFYTALALTEFMASKSSSVEDKLLFFDQKYGICLITDMDKNWLNGATEYFSQYDTTQNDSDVPFIAAKKKNFEAEKLLLLGYNDTIDIPVKTIKFSMDPATRKISIT